MDILAPLHWPKDKRVGHFLDQCGSPLWVVIIPVQGSWVVNESKLSKLLSSVPPGPLLQPFPGFPSGWTMMETCKPNRSFLPKLLRGLVTAMGNLTKMAGILSAKKINK